MIAAKLTFEFAVIMFVVISFVYCIKVVLEYRKRKINTRIEGKE